MMLSDMIHLKGKYVSITFEEEGLISGMDGWVANVYPVQGNHRTIILDYGYGYNATEKTDIKIIPPPPGDKGPFKGE